MLKKRNPWIGYCAGVWAEIALLIWAGTNSMFHSPSVTIKRYSPAALSVSLNIQRASRGSTRLSPGTWSAPSVPCTVSATARGPPSSTARRASSGRRRTLPPWPAHVSLLEAAAHSICVFMDFFADLRLKPAPKLVENQGVKKLMLHTPPTPGSCAPAHAGSRYIYGCFNQSHLAFVQILLHICLFSIQVALIENLPGQNNHLNVWWLESVSLIK